MHPQTTFWITYITVVLAFALTFGPYVPNVHPYPNVPNPPETMERTISQLLFDVVGHYSHDITLSLRYHQVKKAWPRFVNAAGFCGLAYGHPEEWYDLYEEFEGIETVIGALKHYKDHGCIDKTPYNEMERARYASHAWNTYQRVYL